MLRYKYKPLYDPAAQIRLLNLEPGDPDDPICLKGTLSQYRLDSSQAFVALSYEWGDSEPLVDFRLDGVLIRLRYNLWTLLDTILTKIEARKVPHGTQFWIDALCIDQSNLTEKNAQVALMGTIYSSASLVFAWLGRPTSEDPEQVFNYLLSESRALKSRSRDAEYQYKSQRSSDFGKVLAFSNCRYWTRRWILQELLLPKKVIVFWGDAELDLDDLLNIIRRLRTYQTPYTEQFTSFCNSVLCKIAEVSDDGHIEKLPLRNLMRTFVGLDCESKLDRVYALRSLAKDGADIAIEYDDPLEALACRMLMPHGWKTKAALEEVEKLLAMDGPRRLSQQIPGWYSKPHRRTGKMPPPIVITESLPVQSRIHIILPLHIDCVQEANLNWLCDTDDLGIPVTFPHDPGIDAKESTDLTPVRELLSLEALCTSTPSYSSSNCHLRNFKTICGRGRDEDMTSFQARAEERLKDLPGNQWIRHRNAAGGWVVICSDGSVGAVCEGANVGDLICRTHSGQLLVIRENAPHSQLVGTASLAPTETVYASSGFNMLSNRTGRDVFSESLLRYQQLSNLKAEETSEEHAKLNSTRQHVEARMDVWELMLITRHRYAFERLFFLGGHIRSLLIWKSIQQASPPPEIQVGSWRYSPQCSWSDGVLFGWRVPANALDYISHQDYGDDFLLDEDDSHEAIAPLMSDSDQLTSGSDQRWELKNQKTLLVFESRRNSPNVSRKMLAHKQKSNALKARRSSMLLGATIG